MILIMHISICIFTLNFVHVLESTTDLATFGTKLKEFIIRVINYLNHIVFYHISHKSIHVK